MVEKPDTAVVLVLLLAVLASRLASLEDCIIWQERMSFFVNYL